MLRREEGAKPSVLGIVKRKESDLAGTVSSRLYELELERWETWRVGSPVPANSAANCGGGKEGGERTLGIVP